MLITAVSIHYINTVLTAMHQTLFFIFSPNRPGGKTPHPIFAQGRALYIYGYRLLSVFCALHDQLASPDRHAQLTRCFSTVAELLILTAAGFFGLVIAVVAVAVTVAEFQH